MRFTSAAAVVASAALLTGCSTSGGGSTTTSTPSPIPTDPSPINVAQMAGQWTGTMESSNFATRTISMDVVQFGNCVDGVWRSTPDEWVGAISGFAGAASYSGLISIEKDGGRCTSATQISGSVGDSALKWTSAGFSGDCGLPRDLVLVMRRE